MNQGELVPHMTDVESGIKRFTLGFRRLGVSIASRRAFNENRDLE